MAEEAMHPLRRRMVEDMTIRNFDLRTQKSYIRSVRMAKATGLVMAMDRTR